MERREKGYNTKEDWEASGVRTWKDYVWLYNNVVKHYKSLKPIDKVLDIGCGHGYFLDCCVKNGYAPSNLYGIEGEPDTLVIVKAKGYQISSIDLEKDKLPYEDNSFSVVICAQLIEHITHDAGANLLHEIYRVLKKDGMLIIYSPSYFNVGCRTMPFHIYCWKPNEMRDELKRAGFKNLITKINTLKWWDLKKYDEKWHQAKYKKKLNLAEKLLEYAVYTLYLITKWQRLLGQSAFVAYK